MTRIQDNPRLGILASKKARTEGFRPGESLPDFIRTYQQVLAKYELVVTGGTFDDVFRAPNCPARQRNWVCKYPGLQGEVLRPGKDGGLIQLSEYVLSQQKNCDVVIFFTDPQDTEENFPENRQLVRVCAMRNAVLLLNWFSASLWAANESGWGAKDISPAKQGDTLALIAHDNRKLEMCHFVTKHRDRLGFFKRIIATGTTGEYIRQFLDLFGNIGPRVDPKLSGPMGGDVLISNEILEGRCQHVCFFIDPTTAHPHEADIYALFRACTFEGIEVNLRLTYRAAESWIQTVGT